MSEISAAQPGHSSAGSNVLVSSGFPSNPWVQLVFGVVCMAMVANLQYGWTIFVNPIHARYQWETSAIQWAFTLFVLFETWLVPFEAYLADRFGPRPLVMVGAFLIALCWIIYSRAATLNTFYLGAAIGGIGTGLVYGTCIGNAVKWFEKRRGLAAGLTAAGFGAGAALTVVPLTRSLSSSGYQATLFKFALIQGAVVFIAALALKKPPKTTLARQSNPNLLQTQVDSTPMQTLRSGLFWIMYAAFVLVAVGGLMVTAQLAPIATGFKIDRVPVTLLGFTIPALTFALSLNNLMNGVGRPFFGWVSDLIGRESTLFLTFLVEGFAVLSLAKYGSNPVSFVIVAALTFLVWGDIYSIFPALTSDHFGKKYASTNYALLYTAKGCAALFVPLGSVIALRTGSWFTTLLVAALADVVAAFLMIGIVRPMRLREVRRREAAALAPAD
ncbi:MAG: oxalate/formate MFS antiporter [Acidobacteria bacterium]|nr:MAG: oxalate/formate MFS antiporter [Acidobacteriota bacterium]